MSTKKIAILILAILVIIGVVALTLRPGDKTVVEKTTKLSLGDILAPPAAADFYEDENRLKVNKGSVTIKHSGGEEETITDETTLNVGDTIIVSADGKATIYWFDDSVSRLEAGTELTIDKASYNSEKITETDINFNVIKGKVWSKVRSLVDDESEFLSYSGNIVAGVRGSVYNIIVGEDGGVNVESIQHTAFVGELDPATKAVKNTKLVTRGKQAKVDDGDVKVIEIPKTKLDEDWYKNNVKRDREDAQKLKQKNLNRIIKRAGILPGERGYEEKTQLIRQKLNEATDPAEQAKLKVRAAQLKANETLALMIKNRDGQNKNKIKSLLEAAANEVEKSGLPEAEQDKLKEQIQVEIMAWDRAMEDVLPNGGNLYEIKNILRDKQIELEDDAMEQEKMQERIMERRLYELSDAADMGIDKTTLQNAFEQYRDEMDSLGNVIENWDDFQSIMAYTIRQLEGVEGIDPSQLEMLKNYFNSEEFKNMMENMPTMEDLEKMQKDAEAQLENLQDEIDKLEISVPSYTQPTINAEDLETIKELAPYYGGESNL